MAIAFQKQFPKLWQGYWWVGQIYKNMLDFDNAKWYFNQLLDQYSCVHHQGYVGLLEVAERQKEYDIMLDLAFRCQKDFPCMWQGYFWAGKAHLYLKNFALAKSQFKLAVEVAPTQVKIYEALFVLPNVPKEEMLEIAQKYKMHFPKKWFGYYKYDEVSANINHINNLENDLIENTLQSTTEIHHHLLLINFYLYIGDMYKLKCSILRIKKHTEHFLYWQANYYYQIGCHRKAQKILYLLIYKYPTYIEGYNLLMKILKNYNLQKKILKMDNLCKKIFFGLYRGISYSDDNFFCDIKNHYLNYIKKLLDRNENSPYQKNLSELDYLDAIICKYGVDYNLMARKIELLLIKGETERAEHEFSRLKVHYQSFLDMDKLECLLYFYQGNYKKLHDFCLSFMEKHSESGSFIIFYYIFSLHCLNKHEQIKSVYRNFIKDENSHNQSYYVSDSIINTQSNILSGIYDETSFNYLPSQVTVPESAFVKVIENDIKYPVLYLCFSGLEKMDLSDFYTDFDITEIVDRTMTHINKNDGVDFPYLGFSKQSNLANFVIFKDVFRSSHLINLTQILSIIKKQIDYFNPKYIVCTGSSAGGLASIVIGNLIKANLIFSFAPRQPFIMNNSAYPKLIQDYYDIKNLNIIDMSYLQKFNGFKTKTYIALCEYNVHDALSIAYLNREDENLSISYFHGNNHGVQQYIGVKFVFKEMNRIVQMELEHDFKLPIQEDFLVQASAFKRNILSLLS